MSTKSLGVALVTGAAEGIGRAIALRLASDGYKVALNDLDRKKDLLEALAQNIQANGHECFVVPADVSREEEVKEMIESSSRALGGLDVLVANAGILGAVKPMIELSMEEWDQVQQVNIRGLFMCYKWAAKKMIELGTPGRIIGASSYAGKQGLASMAHYSASKFAIRGVTQSAALELGKYGITVNAYAPGAIAGTAIADNVINDPEVQAAIQQSASHMPPFAKPGQPEDIASIVSYLASKEAHYITGQTVSVNAGMHLD